MFESLRSRMAFDAIRKWLAGHTRTRKTCTLETASTIAVLFDASSEKHRTDTLNWVKNLQKNGKKVQMLAFFNDKKPPVPTPDFDFFTAKEISWTFVPNNEKVTAFVAAKNDLLLCINPLEHPAISWVAAHHKAPMKIAMAATHQNDYDLQIDTPAEKGVQYFAEQLNFYLGKIKTP